MAMFFTTVGGAEPTPTPKNDCEKLMTSMLPFAQKMLRQHGEFFPYGGALDEHGAVVAVGATDGREPRVAAIGTEAAAQQEPAGEAGH